jgi:hypothetical protein
MSIETTAVYCILDKDHKVRLKSNRTYFSSFLCGLIGEENQTLDNSNKLCNKLCNGDKTLTVACRHSYF